MNFDVYCLKKKMPFTISIETQRSLIRYEHTGTVFSQDLDAAWIQILGLKEFTELGYNLISVYKGAVFEMPLDKADEIVAFLKTINPILIGKKHALVVDDVYSTAASLFFEDKVTRQTGFLVQVFTTESAALAWVYS